MKQGTVKFFNISKGYGFIKVDNSNDEVFVHHSGLNDTIRENDRVQFELTPGKKGDNAIKVSKI